MQASPVRIRPATAEDWAGLSALSHLVFHQGPTPEHDEIERAYFEPERALIADDDGLTVGSAAVLTRELTVPGAILPAAHVSMVGVAPTHRRRGLLNRMMDRQLRDVAGAGREPIAVLWASEGRIYSRYGYGQAAQRLHLDVMTREVRPPDAPADGRLRLIAPADGRPEFAKIYDRLRATRPGWSSRDDRWWAAVLADADSHRGGASPLRAVVYETSDGPAGYAIWRVKDDWKITGPDGQVRVHEVTAAGPRAYAALWRFLLTIDLARSTTYHHATLDEPLRYLVDEPRRLRATLLDGLWIRLVDVSRALAARRYATAVDVVLDVTDPLLTGNTGRYRLTGGPDGATCVPTGDPADLSCTVLELGAAYLGGVTLSALAAAGAVRERTPGALARATAAFGWDRMPQAVEVF